MQNYLPACKIVATHGVRGEMKAQPLCDGAAFLAKLKQLYPAQTGGTPAALTGVRPQGNVILLCLAGVEDMDAARAQIGKTWYFAKSEAVLPEGRYFLDDLLGCTVSDAQTGRVYGTLTDVDHPAAQDIYYITDEAGEVHMMPAVPEFVGELDPANRRITVKPIPGMFGEAINGDKE